MKKIKLILSIFTLILISCLGKNAEVTAIPSYEYYIPGSPVQNEKAYIGATDGDKPENWLSTAPSIGNYDYSFAVLGDIQIVNNYFPDDLPTLYDYIIDNAEERNTRFCFGMGDITDKDKESEWSRVKKLYDKLEKIMPYSIIRGNHDGRNKMSETFNENSSYRSQMDGFFMDQISIGYTTFSVGIHKWLVITLDWFVDEIHLEWANNIIEEHPDYNVIITVHNFLDKFGTPSISTSAFTQSSYTSNLDVYNTPYAKNPSLNGIDIWNNLAKKHENVKLILSGHIAVDDIKMWQGIGDHGNTVTALLINPQDVDVSAAYLPGDWYFPTNSQAYKDGYTDGYAGTCAGIVTTLYISYDGTVYVEHYSTVKKQWFKAENQFSFNLDLISINDSNPTGSTYKQVIGA